MSTLDLILGGGVVVIAAVAIVANNLIHAKYQAATHALAQAAIAKLGTVGPTIPPSTPPTP